MDIIILLVIEGCLMLLIFLCLTYDIPLIMSLFYDECTQETEGVVTGYSIVNNHTLFLPIIRYQVDGKNYKVKGPHFSRVRYKNFENTALDLSIIHQTNIVTEDESELPCELIINKGSAFAVRGNNEIIETLFPLGKRVKVYYSPSNHRLSYVERKNAYNRKVLILFGLLTFFIVILFLIFNIGILVVLFMSI